MKKNNIVLFGIAVLCACSVPKERQPLTGGQWGEIKNGSAEEVVSSEVLYWQAPPASKEVLHFYDATAHDGTRSLCISADGLANGYWNNRVNLKPWSKYRFKGWIKCENVVAEPQGEPDSACRESRYNCLILPVRKTGLWSVVILRPERTIVSPYHVCWEQKEKQKGKYGLTIFRSNVWVRRSSKPV